MARQVKPARGRRQNWDNPGPRRVGQVGVVESSAHRTGPFEPDQRSFKTDVNFSNTLLEDGILAWVKKPPNSDVQELPCDPYRDKRAQPVVIDICHI